MDRHGKVWRAGLLRSISRIVSIGTGHGSSRQARTDSAGIVKARIGRQGLAWRGRRGQARHREARQACKRSISRIVYDRDRAGIVAAGTAGGA